MCNNKAMGGNSSHSVGALGESVAAKYLKRNGFSIIARNYRKKWGEIDIIARKGKTLHFVEVKSVSCENIKNLSSKMHGDGYRPEENVHFRKLQRLFRTIESYLAEHQVSAETLWQLDVVAVFLDIGQKKARVRTIDNVVL